MEIRNIAIIAHVDHGKTTLTDAIMKQCGFDDAATMDSNALEQERGITIYAKNTSVFYKGTKINIVDTPGHADFGSEVERVLRSIDAVLLVVDAKEGPMPQTRFVLKKSLELGLKPIVVINKIDKPNSDPESVHNMVFELFVELGATNEQLDFPTIYTVGRDGTAKMNLKDESKDLTPLLDLIINKVTPASVGKSELPFSSQVFNLGYDNFLGRLAVARIYSGIVKVGMPVFVKKIDGSLASGKITKLFTFEGINRVEINQAEAGDIVTLAGIPEIYIGETICDKEDTQALPAIKIDEPTITLDFLVNNSPFAGREGKFVTTRQIRDRLTKELEINVGLKVDFSAKDFFNVSGRGELHIAILLENMRREGFELQVSQPQAIIKKVGDELHEPFEEVTVDVPEKFSGVVIEKLGRRKAVMTEMKSKDGQNKMIFEIPTRGILGYRGEFVIDTKGLGILCSRMIGFRPYSGDIKRYETGSMVSMMTGKALGYSLWNLQERGILYIPPAVEVYEGQIIGNTSKGEEMDVNPCKGKQLTNMRASGSDEHIILTPPYELSIERGLEIMGEDDYLEITPKSVRLRKKVLNPNLRSRTKRASVKEDK